MDNKKKKKDKFSLIPKSTGLKIVEIITLLAEAGVMALIFRLGVLPFKYTAILIAVIVLVDIGIFALVSSRKKAKRLLGLIFTVMLFCIMLIGAYYLQYTMNTLNRIASIGQQYEEFDVIVAADSSYEKLKDLEDMTVYTVAGGSREYKEAKGQVKGRVLVNYEEVDDCLAAGEKIVTPDGIDTEAAILVSEANYGMICDEDESFKDKTKILKEVKVPTQSDREGSQIDVTKDSFNVYISGIDVWDSIEQVSRSDVNMILTVNPRTRQVLITSIPRDSYVTLHTYQQLDKLTHTGVYGIDETLSTVEDWLGIEIDYYFRANFSMVREMVNAMDGINVYSDYDFKSHLKPYHYKKGWNYLTGSRALYFARERKAFKDSDQQRIKNQQKVLKAMIRKLTSSEVILTNYTHLLDATDGYMQTSMSQKDMAALVKMQLNDMDKKWTINSIVIKGEETRRGTYSMGMGRPLIVNISDPESVDRAIRLINKVQYPEGDEPVKIKDDKSKKDNIKPTEVVTYHDKDGNVIGHSND